jgi:hypothetical protein
MEHARCLVRCGARHQTVADGEDGEILAQLMAEVGAPMLAAPELSSIQQEEDDEALLRPAKRAKVDADEEEVERLLTSRLCRMRSGSGWPRPPPTTTKLPYHYLRRLATTKGRVRAGALPTTRMGLVKVVGQSLDDYDDNTN